MGNNQYKTVDYNDVDSLKKLNNRSKGERLCRLILESLFETSFSSSYPEFLAYSDKKGGKKTKLEIDLFNSDLDFGVEYQGRQHYVYVKHFHKDLAGYDRSCKRDDFKRKGCHKNGIFLIEVPYYVKDDEMCKFLWDRIPEHLKTRVKKDKIDKLKNNKLVVKKG